jgi:hypothetical protein
MRGDGAGYHLGLHYASGGSVPPQLSAPNLPIARSPAPAPLPAPDDAPPPRPAQVPPFRPTEPQDPLFRLSGARPPVNLMDVDRARTHLSLDKDPRPTN